MMGPGRRPAPGEAVSSRAQGHGVTGGVGLFRMQSGVDDRANSVIVDRGQSRVGRHMVRRAVATRGGAHLDRASGGVRPDAPVDDGATDDTTPSDTTPSDTTPSDTTPSDTTPSDTTPSDATPAEAGTVASLVDEIASKADTIASRVDANGDLDAAIGALDDAVARLDDIMANWDDAVEDRTVEDRTAEPPPPEHGGDEGGSTTERLLSNLLADVMELDDVPATVDFFDDLGADSMVMAHFCAKLRKHPDLPSLSIKEVYQRPTIRSLATSIDGTDDDTERLLSNLLADVMELDDVPATVDFFDDLGADSMVMAHFCAKLRKHPDLPSLSIKEVYQRPTIRSLATSIDGTDDETSPLPTAESPVPALEPATRVPTWQYIGCGAAQLLIAVAFASVGAVVLARLYEWVSAADGVASTYGRAIVFSSGLMVAWSLLPIVVKWTLIGRSRPSYFPVWGFRYLRFWFVKVVINANPMAAFVGTPIFVLYLRALGADIGSGVLILSRQIPVDTDLLTIGDHAVVRKDSSWSCYRAHAGWIQTGPVSIGRGAVVGESTVLDIYTSLGDGAQLGHASALCAGQSVPDGEFRQGAPAVRRTDADLRSVPPIASGTTRRRVVYSSIQLFVLLFVTGPVVLGGITAVAEWRIASPDFLGTDATTSVWAFNRNALIISFVLYFGLLVVGLAVACIVPRMLARLVRPGEVYPLFGIRYWAHRTITRLTNVPVFTNLFGDSSYILHYLSLPRIRRVVLRTDRSQFRSERQARPPLLGDRRFRDDGRGRALDRERRVLEHLVRRVIGRDRLAQLHRQPGGLPVGVDDGRRLPARLQGPGPGRRRPPRTRRVPRIAELRDPTHGGT